MAFGDANSTWGEKETISSSVTYILNYEERLFYQVMQSAASIALIHNERCADLNVAALNVRAAFQKSAKITSFSIGPGPNATNIVTLVAVNSFTPGDIVAISGLGVATYLNGQNLKVGTASPTQFTVGFVHADVTSTGDSGTATQIQTALYLLNVSRATAATAAPGTWY
jgi:hypothetical protein